MKIDLTGKTALVTGASRGIGRAAALALADAGANVSCVATNEALLKEVAAKIEAKGRKALIFKVDVSNFTEVEHAVNETARELGSLDILVNNAGTTRDGLLMRMPEEDWDIVIDVNLKGPFNFLKAVSRTMIRQRSGSVINITSVAGIMGNAGQANYSASKGGLISLTKSAAREYASRSIRVNAIAPGFIETDMSAKVDAKILEQAKQAIPLKRLGQTDEIANAICFLASDLSSYITGHTLIVDGGMAM